MNSVKEDVCRDPRGDKADLTEYIDLLTKGYIVDRNVKLEKWKSNKLPDWQVLGNKYRWFKYECDIVLTKYSRGDSLSSLIPDVAHNIHTLSAVYEEVKLHDESNELQDDSRISSLLPAHILTRLRFGLFVSCLIKDEELKREYVKSIPENEDKVLDTLLAKLDPSRRVYEYVKYPDPIYDPYFIDLALIEEIIEGCDNEAERKGLVEEYLDTYGKKIEASWPYWCFEIGFVMKVFNFDDSYLESHPHYPWELVKFNFSK